MTPGAPVQRVARDRFELRLGPDERRILGAVVGELRAALEDPHAASPDGPLARLFPAAFPDDAEAEASYTDLVHADLVALRLERVETVEATLDADVLDEAGTTAWLGLFNDARLALAQRLDITDEIAGRPPEPGDPDAMPRAVFLYLGWLVSALTDALEGSLPEAPDGAT